MTTRITLALLVTLLALSLAACSPAVGASPERSAGGQALADASAASAESTYAGDPAKLVQEKCTICHPIGRVESAQKDWDGWNRAVDHMSGHGAPLTPGERKAIVDYLTTRK